MSRLFKRLTARARNEEHNVMPRVRGLFESVVSAQQGLVEETEEVDTKFRGANQSDVSAAPVIAPIVSRDDHADCASQPPAVSPTPDIPNAGWSARPSIQQSPTAQSDPVEAVAHTEHHFRHTETLRERIVETPVWHVHEAQPPEASPAAVAAAVPASGDDATPARTKRGARDVAIRLDPPQPPASRPAVMAVDVPPATTAPPLPNREVAPPAGRTVHIHVDRIEVRGVSRPDKSRQAPRRVDNPAPCLEEYLRGSRS